MREGILRLNDTHRALLSNDLGAAAGLLFDIGWAFGEHGLVVKRDVELAACEQVVCFGWPQVLVLRNQLGISAADIDHAGTTKCSVSTPSEATRNGPTSVRSAMRPRPISTWPSAARIASQRSAVQRPPD